jgi:hypothetical protein
MMDTTSWDTEIPWPTEEASLLYGVNLSSSFPTLVADLVSSHLCSLLI